MIRSITRLLTLMLLTLCVTSCTATRQTANPRTMTFPPLAFEVPKSQRLQLSNGMTVYIQEDHELPLVSITAYVNTGSIYEPAEKAGLAALTGTVMRSGGTQEIPPEKLDAELEFMASSIEAGIGTDVGNVSLSTLSRNLDRTLDLFAQVVTRPAFRTDRFELARKRSIESIRRQNDDPKGIADREIHKALYAGHPLGNIPTMESVRTITRDDLVHFHSRYFRPDRTILAVAGDVKVPDLMRRLESVFSGWDKASEPLPVIAPPSENLKSQVLLARKEINQSVIRMGHLGIDKNNPDLYAIRVMDYILGGGFTSRLTTEIRSNQGLAYNADSHFDIGRRFVGTFIAETETKSESTAKAIGLIRSIIAGLTTDQVTDKELDLAKNSIVNAFIFGFAKPDAIVNQMARLEYYGYPAGYLDNYRDNIARVSKEDVLRVARKYLHPDSMLITVVGKEASFDKPLSTFAPVTEIKLTSPTDETPK